MEHFVIMPQIPAGLAFPADMSDRIRYDSEHHRLIFRGVMSKIEFDRLSDLSDDWGYRRPLEDLFRLCTAEDRQRSILSRWIAAIGF